MGVFDKNGNSLVDCVKTQTLDVLVASSEATDSAKANADYLCTGTNDELVIQQAIDYIAENGGGKVRLSSGRFYIGSFPLTDSGDDNVALMLPQDTGANYSIEILGSALPFGASKTTVERGTRFEVTESAYEACSSSSKYTILRAGYVASLPNTPSRVHLTLKDIEMRIPANQKPIMCVDLLYVSRVLVERVQFRAYKNGYNGYTTGSIPPVAVEGCVGMRSVGGSNNGILADYRNMLASAFYEGFKMGGEHIVGINLATIWCVYGFTFGNYQWSNIFAHNITLINCCDERGVNLPLFGKNGWTKNSGYGDPASPGYQAVTMIDFNMERSASHTPGGVLGENAKEVTQGAWRGSIEYSITNPFNSNATTVKFWEDGHGLGVVTRNQAQLRSGTSTVRRGYAPNYMQSFYDTTVGKMLWCIDTATPTWVDAQGNTVA